MPYEVERGVEIAGKRDYGHYPWEQLRIGDSFLVPPEKASRARRAAYMRTKRTHEVFATRTQTDGSLRIWRVG